MEYEGIVVRRVIYKGDDVMISALTKDKMISFLAKGVLKVFSKNSYSTNLFTKSRFEIYKGKEGDFLRVGEVVESYPNINSDFEKLALLDFVSEITNTLLDKRDSSQIYPFLEKTLKCLNEKFSPWTAILIYFAHVLSAAGYELDIGSCCKCGKTNNIIGISYKNGGFVCEDCFNQEEDTKADVRKLKIIRYAFMVDIDNFERVQFEKEECREIIQELAHFLNWVSQLEIKSLTLLEKI